MLDSGVRHGFRDGDPDAVRAVYREYGRLVYSVAYKVLGDRGLAEEATQQAFVQAWRGARNFEPSRELGPWLATIARRVAIDVFRHEARRRHESLSESERTGRLAEVASPAERVHDLWEVRSAMAELPDDERDVVRLQHFEGLTHALIAKQLRVPVGTVKSRSFRAHRRLAARLGHLRESLP